MIYQIYKAGPTQNLGFQRGGIGGDWGKTGRERVIKYKK